MHILIFHWIVSHECVWGNLANIWKIDWSSRLQKGYIVNSGYNSFNRGYPKNYAHGSRCSMLCFSQVCKSSRETHSINELGYIFSEHLCTLENMVCRETFILVLCIFLPNLLVVFQSVSIANAIQNTPNRISLKFATTLISVWGRLENLLRFS